MGIARRLRAEEKGEVEVRAGVGRKEYEKMSRWEDHAEGLVGGPGRRARTRRWSP